MIQDIEQGESMINCTIESETDTGSDNFVQVVFNCGDLTDFMMFCIGIGQYDVFKAIDIAMPKINDNFDKLTQQLESIIKEPSKN
jgi:hypothetical protein